MLFKFILTLLIITLPYNCMATEHGESVVYIHNGNVQVGILVEVGGTIVSLRYKGGKNILHSDSTLWNEPKADRLPVTADTLWKAYHGHTVWLGPQADWWVKQDLNPYLKITKTNWPPDPWLIFSQYKILQQTDSNIIIQSPESPIWGVCMTKNISISNAGKVLLVVMVKNTGSKPISWDIWMNTYMNGTDKAYVPIVHIKDIRMDSLKNDMPSVINNGYFTFEPKRPEKGVLVMDSKAFIYPSEPFIAAFTKENLLLVRFEKHKKSSIHPNQSLVELYNTLTIDRTQDLLELEYHSPYKTLKSGASMQAWETWEVYAYSGADNQQQQIEFLNAIVK